MKAMIYTKYGPPEVLHAAEIEKPVPRDDQVLIRVHATTVSVADMRCRGFNVPRSFWIAARLALGVFRPRQRTLGGELSGVVEDIGRSVTRFKKGDEIYAATIMKAGGYAEYACLAETGAIALKPATMSFEQAAAVPIAGRTALHFLRKAGITSGQRVLVYGASGSVGTYAVQLAKYFGAEVTGVCSGSNRGLVMSLGADAVVDYTNQDFADEGEIYDVILVAVDKASFSDCMRALKKGGTYLNISSPVRTLEMRRAARTSGKTIVTGEHPPEDARDLEFLAGLIDQGALRPVIDRSYPLDEIVEAHRYAERGHKKGNVAVTVVAPASS